MSRVDNKIIIISGAASGIGAATARTLASAGGTVILTDINVDGGSALAKDIAKSADQVYFEKLDVTIESDWQRVCEHVVNQFGGLDVLVNNAGIECIRRISNMSLKEWQHICRINLDGVFLGTKYGIEAMSTSRSGQVCGGSIINMSSVAGIIGTPGQSAYNMTKGGVRLFTKSAALECTQLGNNIRVNSVHPGIIETPLVEAAWKEWAAVGFGENIEETRKNLLSLHPMGRFGRADEVAKAILFLASDDSSFVTGAELMVDGGLTAI